MEVVNRAVADAMELAVEAAYARGRASRDAEVEALRQSINTLQRENDHFRASIGNNAKPCIYCDLPAEDMAKCASGFPGCARADDAILCPHVATSFAAYERILELEGKKSTDENEELPF